MQRQAYSSPSFMLCLLVSMILLGLGALITLTPESGERAFGLDGYSSGFQLVAGLRTSYLGFIVLLLTLADERRALGILLISLALNPLDDFLTVLAAPGGNFWDAAVHLPGFVVTLLLGGYLLRKYLRETA